MTLPQGLAFAVLAGMMALFIWGRLRYDMVALLALFVSVVIGIVPPEKAFVGFSDDIVIIIASALLVSASVARSGIVETVLTRLGSRLNSPRTVLISLVSTVTVMSGFVKNIGALAMLMPVAFQLARRTKISPSYLLMPMAFGSLLGGTMTLIGTSPNIIVSRMRAEMLGEPFRMFDFMPVGLSIAVVGVIFLAFGYRLIPAGRKGAVSLDQAFNIKRYTTEATLPADSPLVGKTVADLEKLGEGEVDVSTIIRERFRRYTPSPNWTLYADDVLLLQGDPGALERVVSQGELQLVGGEDEVEADPDSETDRENIGIMEAVVGSGSPLIDRTPGQMNLAARYQMRLLAVSRRGHRLTHRLRSLRFQPGDVVVLQGDLTQMPEALGELQCLPLMERDIRLGRGRNRYLPVIVLAAAMLLVALQIVPVAFGFFGAAVVLVLARSLSLREAYDVIEWPLLILIAALIPVSEAVQTTGATDLVAGWLSAAAAVLPAYGALALILVAGMAVTPFLNNAATVLVMAPIAAQFATQLVYNPDPFLMAVALGAACDFLTPIGHQCNTLVMGPGGYRFGDYWRLGLPLSIIVVVAGVPLISFFWPIS